MPKGQQREDSKAGLGAHGWELDPQETGIKSSAGLLQSKVGDNGSAGHGQSVGCLMRRETMATPEQSPMLSAPQLSSSL